MEQRPVQSPNASDRRSSGGRRRLRWASLAGVVILAGVLAGVLYRDELVTLAETRSDLQRLRDLKAQQFASQSELDQAKAAADSAAAALTRAREDLRDRVIKAPFTGLVGRRMVSPGALLEPVTPVAELRRTDPLDLLFDVPETALGRIEPGQRVRAATPALPGERFMGELTLVGTAVDPATRTLPQEATFPNPDGRLKPGMFLHTELITGERTLLSVPEAAVIARGPTQHVYVLDAQAAPKTNAGPPQTGGHQSLTIRRQTVKTDVRRDG
jgi:membrane fusion protein (multidrug efflux system)